MKSKEALNKICLECQIYKGKIQVACPFRSISNDYCDEYEQIKKDLEVLETLKKYIVITSNLSDESQWLTFDRQIYNDDIDTMKVFYLLKEWLENDK